MSKQRILYEEQWFTFFIMHQLLSQRFDSLLAKPSLSAAWCHAGGTLQGLILGSVFARTSCLPWLKTTLIYESTQ